MLLLVKLQAKAFLKLHFFMGVFHIVKLYKCYQMAQHITIITRRKRRSEAVARSCSVKKVSLGISQKSQEITCSRVSFLIKL